MQFLFERQSGISVREQVKLQIAQRIRSGLLEAGRKLPSVRQLCADAQISLVTAQRIYRELEQDGLITVLHGKGVFVGAPGRGEDVSGSREKTEQGRFDWQLSVGDYLPRASFWKHSIVRLPPEILDLSNASIHHTLLPLDLLQASVRHSLSTYPAAFGSYSPYQGDSEFLQAISDYLREQNGISLAPHQLMITNGTQQGLDLFARVFLGPGDTIAMETPCFSSAIDTFRLSGANIQPIPLDQEGIRIDLLEEAAVRGKLKAIYTVPTFQNPTGSIMSLKRRKELLEFAESNNVLILEDDPNRELFFSGQGSGQKPPPALKALDQTGRVVYLKGFSKFLFPGMRLGVVAAEGSLYTRLLAAKSVADLGSPLWLQKTLIHFFRNPRLGQYIKRLNHILTQRSRLVMATLASELTPAVRYRPISGGMHVWLTLPPAVSADELIPAAHHRGIHFLPGSIFYPAQPEVNHLRICWTNIAETELPQALAILCEVLNEACRDKA